MSVIDNREERKPSALATKFRLLRSSAFWVALATVACLAPFLTKAFHIDDPLFLLAARQIQQDPMNFYGVEVNWYGLDQPLWEVMQNPPLASYYLALAAAMFGWSEAALHLAFLPAALGVVLGTFVLAQRWCRRPALAALATLLSPAFLISSTNVMCDVLMLCFWVWAVVSWDTGLRRQRWGLLLVAGGLTALAFLTKYFGIALVPLLLVYALACALSGACGLASWKAVLPRALLALAIPVAVVVAYRTVTLQLYAKDLFLQAAAYSSEVRPAHGGSFVLRVLTGLSFAGGGSLSVVAFLPWLWTLRQLIFGAIFLLSLMLTLFGGGLMALPVPYWQEGTGSFWIVPVEFAVFASAGAALAALVAVELWRRRDAVTLLLGLWVLGTLAFATAVNWSTNARAVLPLLPAASILAARRLDARRPPGNVWPTVRELWPLLPAGLFALLIAWVDMAWADSTRAAAQEVLTFWRESPYRDRSLWFGGHWGFQYYMEQGGAKAFSWRRPAAHFGDLMVGLDGTTNQPPMPAALANLLGVTERRPTSLLSAMDHRLGAGFYSDAFGPLPFAFGPVRVQRYYLIEFVMPKK